MSLPEGTSDWKGVFFFCIFFFGGEGLSVSSYIYLLISGGEFLDGIDGDFFSTSMFWIHLSNEKKGPWLFRVYAGMKYYPVMWGLFHKP